MAVAVTRAAFARGDVHLVGLDPTPGSKIKKSRPCLIVSPDELNQHLRTVIVAPMTTGGQAYPWRVACRFQDRTGFVALDQLRTWHHVAKVRTEVLAEPGHSTDVHRHARWVRISHWIVTVSVLCARVHRGRDPDGSPAPLLG